MKVIWWPVDLMLCGIAQGGEKTSDGKPTNKAGVAGFSREKTLEMMEFNRWRNNTPRGARGTRDSGSSTATRRSAGELRGPVHLQGAGIDNR